MASKCRKCKHTGPHEVDQEYVNCGECGAVFGALDAGMYLSELRKKKMAADRNKANGSVMRSYNLKPRK